VFAAAYRGATVRERLGAGFGTSGLRIENGG
jgi:hypothetical protein